jgi:hypothetical protein
MLLRVLFLVPCAPDQRMIPSPMPSLVVGDLLELGVPHEVELNIAAGELLVEASSNVEAALHLSAVAVVKEDLHAAAAVRAAPPAAANNIRREDKVLKDTVVDGRAGAAALNLLESVDGVGALGQLALGDEEDNTAREALLKLCGQDLLDLAHQEEIAQRVEDDDGLLGGLADLDLLHTVEVEAGELLAEDAVVDLQFIENLGDRVLDGAGVATAGLADLTKVGLNKGHPLQGHKKL